MIDLGAGEDDLHLRSGVLDFGKGVPAKEETGSENGGPDPDATLVLNSRGGADPIRSPEGTAEIEDLVLEVGAGFLRHPALKSAGLTGTDWLALFRANIAVESGFDPEARSPVGAIGLGQLMPETASDLGVDPHDPEENLRGSARYLLQQLATFGSADLALAAYNAGPEAVLDHGGIPPFAETEAHVAKVLQLTRNSLSLE